MCQIILFDIFAGGSEMTRGTNEKESSLGSMWECSQLFLKALKVKSDHRCSFPDRPCRLIN